jgi:hypothetical protein
MLEKPFSRAVTWTVVFWLMAPSTTWADSANYTVATDERLEHLNIRACFEGSVPRRLTARNDRATNLLRGARLHSQDHDVALAPQGSTLTLPATGPSACVDYDVDLSGIGKRRWRSGNWRTRDAIVLDPELWLWYPDSMREKGSWRLEFDLPPDYDVSAPWDRLGKTRGRVSYALRERMPGWKARMAIGRFAVESIEAPGGRLRYALLPGVPAPDATAMRKWVNGGVDALLTAHGHLPVPDAQLMVIPIGRGGEPVPWGEVKRGGGDAVHLYIDQRRPLEEFVADWVLVHELSHLLHPHIVARDRWLSEGIASYYQNVLRARAGLISTQSAWDKLHAGFERGMRATPPGRSLAEVSETMMRDRSFMRVYWSGAAIALLADVALRRRSGGSQSLDTALARFRDCCLPSDHSWSARELMRHLDRLIGETVFTELYREHVFSDSFPDLSALYEALGLQPTGATELRLNPAAPGAAICDAIMAAPGA